MNKSYKRKTFPRILALLLALMIFCLSSCELTSESSSSASSQTDTSEYVEISSTKDDESEDEISKPDESVGETGKAPENSSFAVHFIDVGQADSALIICDGKTMLIDGGNKGDSDLLYTYLKKHNISHLDYVVGTHAHEDHIGGLSGALNAVESVGKVYSPVTEYDTKVFSDFKKYTEAKGRTLTVPSVGDRFSLGSANVLIVGCDPTADDPNDTSIVLKITYGETSFLFTGDAEREAEQKIIDNGFDLSATVLKVGHHGADTSTSYPFLREILPEIAVISVGVGNTYGHPTEEALSRLRDADAKVYRTDMQGDIIAKSDGKTVTFTVTKNADADVFGSIGENSTQPDVSEQPTVSEPSDESDPETNNESEPDGTIQVITWPKTIGRNETGTVKIKGKPNTDYIIKVYYKSGLSSASGLDPKTSDEDGYVEWSWKIGPKTSFGTFKIEIEGGNEKIELNFTVQ